MAAPMNELNEFKLRRIAAKKGRTFYDYHEKMCGTTESAGPSCSRAASHADFRSQYSHFCDLRNDPKGVRQPQSASSRACTGDAGTPRRLSSLKGGPCLKEIDVHELSRSRTEMGSQTCRAPQGSKFSVVQIMPRSARLPGAGAGDGRVDPPGFPILHQVPLRDLHGAIGNYSSMCPRRQSSRDSMRTPFNERAKGGFKYWYMERPKPTTFGRYGIGSYKTVLGLGSAPRT